MADDSTTAAPGTATAGAPPIDPAAFQALQTEAAGYRALASQLLGRELTATDTPAVLSAQIAHAREADSRRSLEMRAGLAEGLLSQGLACPDPEYLRFKAQSVPELSSFAQKSDWGGLLGKALEMGLVSKPAAQAATPAVPVIPAVRPAAAAPGAKADDWAHVKEPSDMRKLTASQLAKMKQESPERYRALTQ
jgi:hypothetical protein